MDRTEKKKLSRFRFTSHFIYSFCNRPPPFVRPSVKRSVCGLSDCSNAHLHTHTHTFIIRNTYINERMYNIILYSTREASRFDLLLFDLNRNARGAQAPHIKQRRRNSLRLYYNIVIIYRNVRVLRYSSVAVITCIIIRCALRLVITCKPPAAIHHHVVHIMLVQRACTSTSPPETLYIYTPTASAVFSTCTNILEDDPSPLHAQRPKNVAAYTYTPIYIYYVFGTKKKLYIRALYYDTYQKNI